MTIPTRKTIFVEIAGLVFVNNEIKSIIRRIITARNNVPRTAELVGVRWLIFRKEKK